jgi:predicted nucleic-acid-binding protein
MDDKKIIELANQQFFRSTFNHKWQVDEQALIEFVKKLLSEHNEQK